MILALPNPYRTEHESSVTSVQAPRVIQPIAHRLHSFSYGPDWDPLPPPPHHLSPATLVSLVLINCILI